MKPLANKIMKDEEGIFLFLLMPYFLLLLNSCSCLFFTLIDKCKNDLKGNKRHLKMRY